MATANSICRIYPAVTDAQSVAAAQGASSFIPAQDKTLEELRSEVADVTRVS